jgi:sulfotransferase 6B1
MQLTSSVARHRWTLQRFGLSPSKSPLRVINIGAPRVFCVSIPKAGTHLLERALCLHPRLYRKVLPTISDETIGKYGGLAGLLERVRPGQVIVSHLRFAPEYPTTLTRADTHAIFLIRDPRDIVVSQVHYVSKEDGHRHHDAFAAEPGMKEKLTLAIAGNPAAGVASIRERLEAYAGWLGSGCLVVRFEDLIGPNGGGDGASQLQALRSIYGFVGLKADQTFIESVSRVLFSPASPTFRKGSIGQWRSFFDPELETLMSECAGDLTARYGYA